MREISLVAVAILAAIWSSPSATAGSVQKPTSYEMGYVNTAAGRLKLIHTPSPDPVLARQYVKLAKIEWWADGFGAVLLANLTIKNKYTFDVKDAKIACLDFAPSGTPLGANARTVFQIFPAGSTRTVKRFNMGFMNSQTKSLRCEISDFAIIPNSYHPPIAATLKKSGRISPSVATGVAKAAKSFIAGKPLNLSTH